MNRRLGLYLGIAMTLAAALLLHRWIPGHSSPPERAAAPAPPAAPAAGLRLPVPCLQPDVRLLQAVGDLHRMLTGRPFEPAVAHFARGRWFVSHRGVDVGSVPEYPDFADMTRLLSGWALRLGVRDVFPPRPAPEQAAAARRQLDAMHAVLAAAECDRIARDGTRSAELLTLGAGALVALELGTTDGVGVADRVAARALALVAAGHAIDSTALARERCLLAHRMGYGAHAWTAADRLPERDPIRLFVRQEDSLLAVVAAAPGASREACFLRLLRLARAGDLARWSAWLARSYGRDDAVSLPVLGTSFLVNRFESQMLAAYLVFLGVASELRLLEVTAGSGPGAGEPPALGALVADFEGTLEGMPPRADGVFLDRELLRAYYRGSFYTAIWTMGEHYRRALSSLPATRDFAAELASLSTGPGAEFSRWYTHLAEAKSGRPSLPDLVGDVGRMRTFGAPLLFRTCEEVRDHARYGSVEPRRAAILLARRLDTRPSHRSAFSTLAGRDLLMLPLAEALLGSAARAASPLDPDAQGRWARLDGDRPRLEALLAQPGLTADQQAVLLANLRAVAAADSAAVCAAYRRAIARHPDSWRLVEDFASYASRELEAHPLARAAIERWLARHRVRNDLEVVVATASLARTYEREGRWAEALRIVSPVTKSQQFGALARTAVALDRLGRSEVAETLAVSAWQRYPSSAEAQSLVADLFWRHGKYDQAAEALANPRFRLSPDDWRWTLAPHFVDCFAGRTEEALKAVDALSRTELPGPATIGQLATGCGNEGRRDLAFEIHQRVRADGLPRVEQLLHAYYHLKRWKGRAAGLEWIRPRLAPLGNDERAFLTYEAFRQGEAELLWETGPVPRGADGEFLWLLRAAAARRWPDDDARHEQELAGHFARHSNDRYRTLGRHLLGLEPDSVARALADSPDHECEVFYYLGVKAQSEGRYRDAADCFARSLATQKASEGEYQWAHSQLLEWHGRHLTLTRLAEVERDEREASLVAGGASSARARGH